MNKEQLKQVHQIADLKNRKTSWSINPERPLGTPYKVNKDSLSDDGRERINAVKDKLTYGNGIDDDPFFQ